MSELNARQIKKRAYGAKLISLLNEYSNVMVLNIDNVGSKQIQQVRLATRGRAVFLMGKNTIIRRVLRDVVDEKPHLAPLLEVVRGNVGFCFTNEDLVGLRKEIQENQVPAPAKTAMFAPVDVFVEPGPTPLDPGQTSFFQALNIATKISRGAIEILTRVKLITAGERVSSSAVALLTKLGIKPFFFGIKVTHVLEGESFYDASVMDLTENDILNKFFNGVRVVAALSLALRFPTPASVPHSICSAFRALLAISLETEYEFEESKLFKEMLANPDAFAAPAADAAGDAGAAAAEPEEESDEEEGAAVDIFGGDEEDY